MSEQTDEAIHNEGVKSPYRISDKNGFPLGFQIARSESDALEFARMYGKRRSLRHRVLAALARIRNALGV